MSSETMRLTPNPHPFATKLPARPTAVVPEVAARAIGAGEAEDGDELIVDFLPEMTRLEQQRGELAFERRGPRDGRVRGRARCTFADRRPVALEPSGENVRVGGSANEPTDCGTNSSAPGALICCETLARIQVRSAGESDSVTDGLNRPGIIEIVVVIVAAAVGDEHPRRERPAVVDLHAAGVPAGVFAEDRERRRVRAVIALTRIRAGHVNAVAFGNDGRVRASHEPGRDIPLRDRGLDRPRAAVADRRADREIRDAGRHLR